MVQVAMRRGTARSFDHAQLVHAQWLHIIRLNIQVLSSEFAVKATLPIYPPDK